MRFSRLPKVISGTLLIFFGLALLAPLPFVVLSPGYAQNVFPNMIKISKPTYSPSGKLFLTSILISNPDAPVFGAQIIYSWIRSDQVVYPRTVFYPDGTRAKDEVKVAKAQMSGAQSAAKIAALALLARNFPKGGFQLWRPEDISISVKGTGGPSGGLVFTLGIVELLTSQDLFKGRSIAGTGTIDVNGVVGSIGGVAEKLITARRAGATIFFAPLKNCSELRNAPSGLQVIAIGNVQEAVDFLRGSHPLVPGLQGCRGALA